MAAIDIDVDPRRDLALFNLAFDSKLRGCDVVYAIECATVRQKKTGCPVRFELTDQTRAAIAGPATPARCNCF